MATLTITVAAGGQAGAAFRKLAQRINEAASALPDANPTGADTVLTIDNGPSSGLASVQITAGPITSALYRV